MEIPPSLFPSVQPCLFSTRCYPLFFTFLPGEENQRRIPYLFQLLFAKSTAFPSLRPSNLPASSRRSSPLSSTSLSLRLPTAAAVGPIDLAFATVEPTLRHASVLFFKSGYNVQIVVDGKEPEEALLRRFRREVAKAGVIQE
ncbi:30S ribosomal protein S21, chloroplastic-like [Phoenix dactylifera]|uniref:30S ribosomal protein S21, chloroplastic-like n=1 Tax=Phoenix dactylifera TaxID=42345 RepID=A0A8B8ZR30_PHODC|nr:30S ribosomal protein S21, chloroplastic-like [Phoenix dactylifera]